MPLRVVPGEVMTFTKALRATGVVSRTLHCDTRVVHVKLCRTQRCVQCKLYDCRMSEIEHEKYAENTVVV